MPTRELQGVLSDLTTVMIGDLNGLWNAAASTDDAAFRALMIDAYPEVVTPYVATASDLSALAYDDLAPELGYRAVPAELPPVRQFQSSAAWALSQRQAFDLLAGSAQRAIFNGSRQTVIANAEAEQGGTWARYASGTACRFCQMLATRGDVYSSEAAATRVGGRGVSAESTKGKRGGQGKGVRSRGSQSIGDRYHDHCRCMAVAVRPGRSYEPPSYVSKWEADYQKARDLASPHNEYGAVSAKSLMAAYRQLDK